MTAKQELLTMWEQVDESGKQLIFDMLACTVAFGGFLFRGNAGADSQRGQGQNKGRFGKVDSPYKREEQSAKGIKPGLFTSRTRI